MNISYEEFKKRIVEHALYVDDLSRFDNYLKHVKDEKSILKDLENEMSKFKEMISHFNDQSVFKLDFKNKDEKYYLLKIQYNEQIEKILIELFRLLRQIENPIILEKANRIVYGSEYEMNFHIQVDVEYKNFNRIHIVDDLPYSLRNLGLGKMLYKNIIKKLGWISSNSTDSSIDSKFVWDSLSKDTELYTCLKDQSIICFDSKLDVNIIENILRKWLKGSSDYVIDSDMIKRYPDFNIE